MSGDSTQGPTSPVLPISAATVAERIWSHAAHGTNASADVHAIVERVLTDVDAGLRRWIGAEGYASLLARATTETLPLAPALAEIPDLLPSTALDASVSTPYGDAEIRLAVIALLTTMMRLLGVTIGDTMAIRLVELSGTPSPRGTAGPAKTERLP